MTELIGTVTARPRSEYHEDMGPVLWWTFPVDSAPYVGSPSWDDWPLRDDSDAGEDYYTHWTPIPMPPRPWPSDSAGDTNGNG